MSWQFPQGIEVLVKKASIDPDFAELLLADREAAAREIGLELDRSEAMMLAAVPTEQLEAIIAQTVVPHEHRRAFLGKAAAAMLTVLAATATGLAEAGLKGGGAGGIQPPPAPTGIRPDPLPVAPETSLRSRVIAVLVEQLRVPKEKLSGEMRLAEDLHVDARRRETLRRALEARFEVPMPTGEFQKRKTIDHVVEFVKSATVVGPRVIRVIAKELRLGKEQVTPQKLLLDDLKLSTGQRSRIRKELSKEFRLYIPWKTLLEFRTVGEVVDYIDKIIKRRDAAKQPNEPPVLPSPVTRGVRPDPLANDIVLPSRGNRPDVPPSGGRGGIRPGSPPPRPSGPFEQAEEARRQAEEVRRRMREGR